MDTLEAGRLQELAAYGVMDTAPEDAFDALTRAAALVTGAPTALVSLLDDHRQWFKARRGFDLAETSRDLAFCEHVLRTEAPVIVPDTTRDPRFATNALVTGEPGLRFYAGFPLRTPAGAVLGSLCVLDHQPRPDGLDPDQVALMTVLADQVMTLLELRRAIATRDDAVAQLGASRQLYRSLVESATDIVSRHAPDGTIRYVSPSVRDVLGYDPVEELGAAPDRVHPDDLPALGGAMQQALAGSRSSVVVRSRHADGSYRTLEILLAPITDEPGTVVELHLVSRDVTDRESAARALALSEERFRVLFEASPIGQVEMSPDGTLVGVNAVAAELAGVWPPAALLGLRPASATVPEDREAQRVALETAAARPGTVLHTQRRVERPDGRVVEVAGTLTAVAAADGSVERLIGTVVDVTERNATNRRLVELTSELERAHDEAVARTALLTTVLDTVDVGIVACDAQGHLTLLNRAARELHGLDADSSLDPAVGFDPDVLYAEDGTTPLGPQDTPLVRVLREGAVDDVDLVVAPAGLPARQLRCTGRALRDDAGTVLGAVVAMADVTAARADARTLAEQADFTAVLLEGSHAVMWACDTSGRPTYVNATGRRLLGWPLDTPIAELEASGELARLTAGLRTFHADGRDMPPSEHPVVRALTEGDVGDVEVRVSPVGGPSSTLLVEASAFHDADGRVRGAVATGYDITELRASEQRFRAAFRDGPTPTARLDAAGRVQEVNAALRRFLSVRSSELVGRRLDRHGHPEDRATLAAALSGPGTGTEPAEIRFVLASGSVVWCEVAVSRTAGADGQPIVLAQLLDVDNRKAHEHRLERAAQVDDLTGLSNRSHLLSSVSAALASADLGPVGLLFLDLDGFKAVNDAHGHDAGDAVLLEVARRLLSVVRPHDVVARLGGDEFVVLCPFAGGGREAAALVLSDLAERLEAVLDEPVAHRGGVLEVAGSVGGALAAPGWSAELLLEAADRAMYERKRARQTGPGGAPLPAS